MTTEIREHAQALYDRINATGYQLCYTIESQEAYDLIAEAYDLCDSILRSA